MSFSDYKDKRRREEAAAACVKTTVQPTFYRPGGQAPSVPVGRALARIGYPHVNRLGWIQRSESVGCRLTSEAIAVIRDWLVVQRQEPHLHALVTPRDMEFSGMTGLGEIRETASRFGLVPTGEATALALLAFWVDHPAGQPTTIVSTPLGRPPEEGQVDSRRLFYIESRHGVRWLGVRSARAEERLSPDSRLVFRVARPTL